ncbi:hypothetical protein F4820DRAFT_25321 [Hypoxylon rubiginosum]|uniref:Uncharacterized protein n=1 Tax=Hypoxylon rubiginosum TaxID=110542 RepID=A0ACB9YT25_9PEZI|nr:hypothetical protein F4820DRAFT_25321 [Hypoxylon rubiginosum]
MPQTHHYIQVSQGLPRLTSKFLIVIFLESAYERHISYCKRNRNRPRRRPRSCKECHSAKAKYSFEPECSCWRSKGLRCVYEGPIASTTRTIEIVRHRNSAPNVAAGTDHDAPTVDDILTSPMPPINFGSSTTLGFVLASIGG